MCGIVGITSLGKENSLKSLVLAMNETIIHRGPDGDGIYQSEHVCLGHRRLAIIDPEHGKQPLATTDGRFIVTFNGEIYNYLELRRELITLGYPIQSYSDTEIIPYAYQHWGKQCVNHFRGMFAFALWDRDKKELFCARDRVGIKPFYYFNNGEYFVFASEIKAILASGLVDANISQQGLQDYITFQFCLHNDTLFADIFKLPPAHHLTVKQRNGHLEVEIEEYWQVNYQVDYGHDEKYYTDNLLYLLEDSINLHLRSDVPVGAHLSGGLDSTTVACLAAKHTGTHQLKTFTGAFREGLEFDETEYAKAVARDINADYYETYISGDNFAKILPKLIYHMDEPLAGPGLIPQYYVSKLASEQVKVVLGGQGGDELYVGYARYFVAYLEKCLASAIWPDQVKLDPGLSLAAIAPNLPLLQNYKPMLKYFWQNGTFDADDKRYFRLTDRREGSEHMFNPDIFANFNGFERFAQVFNQANTDSMINKMLHFDLKASLPALLHVEDRTSMAVSIESRVPLLDHKIIEFLATVPAQLKFADGKTKHLFRETIKNIIPAKILNRTDKKGFPVPLNHWIKGEAKEFVEDLLFSQTTINRGIFNQTALQSLYRNNPQFSRSLWGAICLELWFREFKIG